jgi:hypothetical protein
MKYSLFCRPAGHRGQRRRLLPIRPPPPRRPAAWPATPWTRSWSAPFKDIAAKYKGQGDAVAKLSDKVRKGGAGVWGPIPMPPNPDTKISDAT